MTEKMLYSKNYKDEIEFDYALSLSDLELVDGFKFNDPKTVERILFENGFDLTHGWHTDFCLHRNLQNKVVNGLRFCGKLRQDEEWIKLGGMSTEDTIYTCKDAGMRVDLMGMSRHPKNTDRVIKAAKEWKNEE